MTHPKATRATICDQMAKQLQESKTIDRYFDAEIAVALYRDQNHEDSRDNTYSRAPRPYDEVAPGYYWVSGFSGMSSALAPRFTGDKLLKRMAIFSLLHDGDIRG